MHSFQVILEVSCDGPGELEELLDRLRELGTSPGVDAYYWRPLEDANVIDVSNERVWGEPSRSR